MWILLTDNLGFCLHVPVKMSKVEKFYLMKFLEPPKTNRPRDMF